MIRVAQIDHANSLRRKIAKMQKKIAMGISFPKRMIRSIDKERGDVSRSCFVLKLPEQVYEEKKQKNGVGSQDELQVRAMDRSCLLH